MKRRNFMTQGSRPPYQSAGLIGMVPALGLLAGHETA
jgi:hypothetical protein